MRPLYLPLMAVIAAGLLAVLVDRDKLGAQSALKGESNTALTFYGKAVGEAGEPVQGALFSIDVEAIPPDWTYETRGKPHLHSSVTARSKSDGCFQFQIVGHILRFKQVELGGYQHFFDRDTGSSKAVDNTFYQVNASSDLW